MRWGYLIPRLFVVVALVAFWNFGVDPLTRFGLESGGEMASGRPMTVVDFRSQLWPPRIEIDGVEICEDDRLDQTEFEVGRVSVELDRDAVKQRRFIAREVRLDDVTWNAPAEFEALPEDVEEESEPSAWSLAMRERAETAVRELVGDVQSRLREQLDPDNLETVQLARSKEAWYRDTWESVRQDAETLKAQARQFEADYKRLEDSPERLANVQEFERLVRAAAEFKQRAAGVRDRARALRTNVPRDVAELNLARRRDVERVRTEVVSLKAEPGRLVEAVLGPTAATIVDQIAVWAPRWMRLRQSGDWKESEVVRHRGRDIDFLGLGPMPAVAAQKIHLAGLARFGDDAWPFEAELHDVVAVPWSMRTPVRFRWASGGPTQVQAAGAMSFRGSESHLKTTFHIDHHRPLSGLAGGADRASFRAAAATLVGDLDVSGDHWTGACDVTFADASATFESDRPEIAALLDGLQSRREELHARIRFGVGEDGKTCDVTCTELAGLSQDFSDHFAGVAAAARDAAVAKVEGYAADHVERFRAKLSGELAELESSVPALAAVPDLRGRLMESPIGGKIRQVAGEKLGIDGLNVGGQNAGQFPLPTGLPGRLGEGRFGALLKRTADKPADPKKTAAADALLDKLFK